MDIQLFVVVIIGIVVGIILLRWLYLLLFTKKKNGYCGGCTLCDAPHGKEAKENCLRSS